MLYQKALLWSHLSTGRSPRMILASPGKFCQTTVWLFYVSVPAVGSSWVSYHSIPFDFKWRRIVRADTVVPCVCSNCNKFLGEMEHYLTEVQGCQYFCP